MIINLGLFIAGMILGPIILALVVDFFFPIRFGPFK